MIGKIYIQGQIGTFEDEKGVELIDVISQVRKQPEATSFEVYINSEGGVVDTGFDILNFIRSIGVPITTIGKGMVASIATVIFMAGNKRIVAPGTKFMIHLPMGGISFATAEEMEEHSKHMRAVENNVISFYTKELGLNKEAISPLLKNETWLNEKQLLDLGFVTPVTEMKISAIARVQTKNKNKMSKKNLLKTLLAAIGHKEVNKVIYTADEKELVFPDLEEESPIEVGANATLDGQPVGGTEEAPVQIVGQDGNTYVFVDSKVKEIIEPGAEEDSTDEVTTDELIEALAQTLEYTSELSERVGAIETEVTGMKKQRDEAVSKLAIAEATIAKLKGSSKSPDTDKKDKNEKKTDISSTIAQWRKNKLIKK